MSKLSSILALAGTLALLAAGIALIAVSFGVAAPAIGILGMSTAGTLAAAGGSAVVGALVLDSVGEVYDNHKKNVDAQRQEQLFEKQLENQRIAHNMQRESQEQAHNDRIKEINLQRDVSHEAFIQRQRAEAASAAKEAPQISV